MPRYVIRYASAFLDDFRALDAFDRPRIRAAILILADQAEVPARNRRPLEAPLSWCSDAAWQLRIGDHRVLYRVELGSVHVLRVGLKGSRSTEEMGS